MTTSLPPFKKLLSDIAAFKQEDGIEDAAIRSFMIEFLNRRHQVVSCLDWLHRNVDDHYDQWLMNIPNSTYQKLSHDFIRFGKILQSLHLRKFQLMSAASECKITKTKRGRKPKTPIACCSQCNSVHIPEWRKGPNGTRSLCNACGLFYSKLTKKFGAIDSEKFFIIQKKSKSFDRTLPTAKFLQKTISNGSFYVQT